MSNAAADNQLRNSGITAVRASFDEGALSQWMAANVEGFAGPLIVSQFKGGQSNPTYRLDTPGSTYVLRRKPPGDLLTGAHAIDREARVMAALGPLGFPVPRIYAVCEDPAIIGTSFFVMAYLDGRILWNGTLPDVPRERRREYYTALNETIARLHGVDHVTAGLADYGRTGRYCERQIGRWSKQYLADAPDAGRDEHMDRLIEWLPANMPLSEETSIVHGDFRIDNVVMHPTEPRIIGVLDWELSTLGNPVADFAYHLMVWRLPPSLISGLSEADLPALGIPSEEEYVADYCRRTGRETIPNLDFYVAFNMFRFAAILHGIKARLARGTAASAHAADLAASVPLAARLAWMQTYRAQ